MRRILPLVLLSALLVAAPGCGNKPDDTPQVERAPQNAVTVMAREVQAKEAGVLVVPRVGDAFDATRAIGKGVAPFEALIKEVGEELGLSADDRKTWAQTGLDLEGPALGLLYKNNPVMVFGVRDPRAVQTFFAKLSGGRAPKLVESGTYPIWRGGLSWRVVEGVVFVSEHPRGLTSVCTRCVAIKGTSLAEDAGFWAFQRELMSPKALAGFYLPARGELYGDMAREFADELDYGMRRNTDFGRVIHMLGRATGAGLAIQHDEARTRVEGWLGLDPKDAREVVALFTPEGGASAGVMVREDAGAFARVRVSPTRARQLFADLMSRRAHAEFERELARSGIKLPEVIANLGGEAAVAWYPSMNKSGMRSPLQFPIALTLAFKKDGDATAALAHLEELMRKANLNPTRRDVQGVQALSASGPWPQPQLLAGPRVLVIAGLDVDEASAVAMARAAHQTPLSSTKDPLKRVALDGGVGFYGGPALTELLQRLLKSEIRHEAGDMLAEALSGALAGHIKATPTGLRAVGETRPGLSFKAFAAREEAERAKRKELAAFMDAEALRLSRLIKQAREAEQTFSDASGAQPWYAPDPKNPERAVGKPVPAAERTFPGGVLVSYTSQGCIPSPFYQSKLAPSDCKSLSLSEHDAKLRALFGKIDDKRFQLLYTTNGSRGAQARAELRLAVDMNVRSRQHHTVVVSFTVSEAGEVRVSPPTILNDHE